MGKSTSERELAIMLVIILVFSISFPQVTLSGFLGEAISRFGEIHISLSFPQPNAMKMGQYDWLKMENCSFLTKPGQPMLPIKSVTVKLPEKSIITNVRVNVIETSLEGRFLILPAPTPTVLGSQAPMKISKDPTIYSSKNLFPKEQYVYSEANGIDRETNTRVKYLILNIFPLRYLPTENRVIQAEKATIDITYLEPLETLASPGGLENMIITSPTLESYALELAEWKNSTGIHSKVLNTTWIYNNFNGVDNQEKIRNCIKHFVAQHQIMYVTIFGDADQVPVRYAYIPDPEAGETYIPTDLYYADLDGTWDDNGDGLYADQENDAVDGMPDVYVGRIPPSLTQYAQVAVDKIKGYQQQFDPSQNWTRRIVLAAGTCSRDGFTNTDKNGTTILKDYIASVVNTNMDIVKLYESAGNLSTVNMCSEISKGALFANFAGHGDPGTGLISVGWLFYWVIPGLIWNGYGIVDVQKLTNELRLPVVTTMACSTARFDDTDCIGEWFVLEPDGGSIAYFGATRVAWVYFDELAPFGFMGEMDRRIYENFYEGSTRLGQMWGETVSEYAQSHVWNYEYASVHDVKTLMEFVLLGDPTVRIYNPDYPETLHVPQEYPTIQAAINAAYDGDTILVSSGTYIENVIVNKSISLIGENQETTVIDGNGSGTVLKIIAGNVSIKNFTIQNSGTEQWNGHDSGILICDSNGNNISKNIITNNRYGITLWYSNNSIVEGNLISQNDLGVSLTRSNDNILSENTVSDNIDGIVIYSSNNILADNQVLSNTELGIYIGDMGNNILSNNNASYNEHGILISFSQNNTLIENVVANNTWYGICLSHSENNTLIGNYVHSAISEAGINIGPDSDSNTFFYNYLLGGQYTKHVAVIDRSEGNFFYHNNFGSGMFGQVKILTYGYSNVWDDGYPSGGNFWGYCGVDEYSGPNQDQLGSDGICDTRHVINVDNRDNYPLRNPWPQPISSFVYTPLAPTVNETVTFNASSSYARDGFIVSYEWDFDDGNTAATSNLTISHTYTIAGTYTVMLTVTDNDGLTDYVTKSITIGKLNSTISISAYPTTITIDQSTTINGTITPTREGATVTIWYRHLGEYIWGNLTTTATDENSQYSYVWTPIEAGTYELKARSPGDQNTFSAESSTITIIRWAHPVASFTYSPLVPSVGEEITFNASSSYDLDEDIVFYRWDFDDGNISSTVNSTITHIYTFPGAYNVTLTIIDSWGLNSSFPQMILVKMPTCISVSLSAPSTYIGFKVNVTGTLRDMYGNCLENETVVLYYTVGGTGTWIPITSDTTDSDGQYFAKWIPPATGYFEIKAEWAGNITHFGASNTTMLSSLAYTDQYVFSVESNSTISELAFNTKNWKLSFSASGPNGTRGYVRVTVAKSLVADIANIRVYMDGRQFNFSIASLDDSWLLTFNYVHSVHKVEVDLDINIIPELSSFSIIALFLIAILLTALAYRRKKQSNFLTCGQ